MHARAPLTRLPELLTSIETVNDPPACARPIVYEVTVSFGGAAGAVTVIVFDVPPVAPESSVTVKFAVYVPAFAYMCLAVGPRAFAPSPKSHA